jgi:hypothetical protein
MTSGSVMLSKILKKNLAFCWAMAAPFLIPDSLVDFGGKNL